MRKFEYFLMVVIAIFAAIVLPLFYKEHSMNLGTTSDIVIALSNIVMAGAALYAASKAKDWLNEKKASMAFDQAISASVEFDRVKLQIDLFHNNLLKRESESYQQESYSVVKDELEKLQHSILTMVRLVRNCERFGFDFKSDIKSQITESFSSYHNTAYKFYALKKASYQMTIINTLNGTGSKLFDELKDIHERTDIAAEMMNKKIDEIFDF